MIRKNGSNVGQNERPSDKIQNSKINIKKRYISDNTYHRLEMAIMLVEQTGKPVLFMMT